MRKRLRALCVCLVSLLVTVTVLTSVCVLHGVPPESSEAPGQGVAGTRQRPVLWTQPIEFSRDVARTISDGGTRSEATRAIVSALVAAAGMGTSGVGAECSAELVQKAWSLCNASEDRRSRDRAFLCMGEALADVGMYDEALDALVAVEASDQPVIDSAAALAVAQIAEVLYAKGDKERALALFAEACSAMGGADAAERGSADRAKLKGFAGVLACKGAGMLRAGEDAGGMAVLGQVEELAGRASSSQEPWGANIQQTILSQAALAYWRGSRPLMARRVLEEATRAARQADDDGILHLLLIHDAYAQVADEAAATAILDICNKSMRAAHAQPLDASAAEAHARLGFAVRIYAVQYHSSLRAYRSALTEADEEPEPRHRALLLLQIAGVAITNGDHDVGREALRDTEELATRCDGEIAREEVLGGLAVGWTALGEYATALTLLEEMPDGTRDFQTLIAVHVALEVWKTYLRNGITREDVTERITRLLDAGREQF